MKKIFCFIFILGYMFSTQAQSDTVFYYKNNQIKIAENDGKVIVHVENQSTDSAENLLFEGVYGEDYSSEVTTSFSFSKFINPTKKLNPHGSGLFWGFSSLSTRDLSIANVPNAVLKYSSYEVGWTMFGMNSRLSSKYGWLFFAGLGLRVQQYNTDNNTVFVLEDNCTVQAPAPDSIYYSTSKLSSWYIHVPVLIEWQKPIHNTNFFIQAGFEFGVKLSTKSKTMYRDKNEKIKNVVGTGMNVNPLTADVKVEIGFGDIGLYARYGLVPTFKKGKGPDVIPVSAGVIWHF